MIRPLISIAAICTALAINSPARAMACDVSYENNLTPNAGCELGSTSNDTMGGGNLQVNADMLFGFDDWLFAEKEFDDAQNIDIGFTIAGDGESGTWSIDDVWSMYSHVMIIAKGGNSSDPGVYVAWLLGTGDTSGTYTTPFSNPANGRPRNISHFSAYVRHGMITDAVPLPAALWLFIGGLGVLGVLRRTR